MSAQALAYAEYRVFAVLARHAVVHSARVVLRRNERDGTVVCAVTVTFEPTGSARTRASGPQAAVAIDRAVERIINLMRRRTAAAVSI
jgi:hypothetical protein